MLMKGDAEPAQLRQPAGRLPKIRARKTGLLLVRWPGRKSFAA